MIELTAFLPCSDPSFINTTYYGYPRKVGEVEYDQKHDCCQKAPFVGFLGFHALHWIYKLLQEDTCKEEDDLTSDLHNALELIDIPLAISCEIGDRAHSQHLVGDHL